MENYEYMLAEQPMSQSVEIPLTRVDVSVEFVSPLAITTQHQYFINSSECPIEARCVFPIPLDATVLSLDLMIGDRTLVGVVSRKQVADQRYEQMITSGDAAVLLTELSEGMYQLLVGNVLPDEPVRVSVTWSQCLKWAGNALRYRLPAVIGQHYGSSTQAGIDLTDAPSHSGLAAYEFNFRAKLLGDLHRAAVACPTHSIKTSLQGESLNIELSETDWLDRSLVCDITVTERQTSVLWTVPDGDSVAALGLVQPIPIKESDKAANITLLVDCSGSMAGKAMEQARESVREIISSLNNHDTCHLIAFGSATKVMTPRRFLKGEMGSSIWQLVDSLAANLGGTEMMAALKVAVSQTPEHGDIFLITDGQLYASDLDIKLLSKSKRRFFSIGVGSATSEKILLQLSELSGGACELVSPNEDMASHVLSHFRRLRSEQQSIVWHWPEEPLRATSPSVVFAGDTVVTMARLPKLTTERIEVSIGGNKHWLDVRTAEGLLATHLARITAHELLPKDNIALATREALHYQLLGKHTTMIAVLERGLAPESVVLPTISDVPQMDICSAYDRPAFYRNSRRGGRSGANLNLLDIPPFLRTGSMKTLKHQPEELVDEHEQLVSRWERLKQKVGFAPAQDDMSYWLKLDKALQDGQQLSDLLSVKILPLSLRVAVTQRAAGDTERKAIINCMVNALAAMPRKHLSKLRALQIQLRQLLKFEMAEK